MRETYGNVLGKESEKMASCGGAVASWDSEYMEQSCKDPALFCGIPSCTDTTCGAFPSIPDKHIELMKQETYPKEKGKVGSMSFAGVISCAGKIIGFADKRSSVRTRDGYAPDQDRPDVQKLFWNGRFIAAFTGTNSAFILEDGVGKKLYMEDLIRDEMQTAETPYGLAVRLSSFLRENAVIPFDDVCVDAGAYAEDGRPALFHATFSSARLSFAGKICDGFNAHYTGNAEFVKYFDENRLPLMTTSADALEKGLKEAYGRLVENGKYCTVGNDWDVHAFERQTDLRRRAGSGRRNS